MLGRDPVGSPIAQSSTFEPARITDVSQRSPWNTSPTDTTLTFLFTDIEGSTEKLTRLGGAYAQILADHHVIIRTALSAHDGREVDTAGDGFFAVFSSPRACINAAIEMQRGLCAHEWVEGECVRVRMGLHTGEATEVPVGLVGLDVHKAARIMAAANGGQILVSEATATLVRDRLDAGVTLRDLGSHRLKDLSRSESLFQLEAEGLETEFPPVRTLDNPALKHNLPVQVTTFLGRSKECEQLRALVNSERLVTLTGAGGSGKTRLALQVASDLLDGSGGGVWFVDLAPISDQTLVASTVASVLHVQETTLYDSLASRRILLILDNCEHLIDACAKLADGLLRSCPDVHMLVTSREPLGIDGEHVYKVPSLSFPSTTDDLELAYASGAVQLFAERAKSHSPEFVLDESSLPSVISICARLDGIPLALELAAARLRALSISEVAERVSDQFRLLTGGSRTALPRHQTLRATMDWSYEALNQRDQQVLNRLSVFSGGHDLPIAEAVCTDSGLEGFDVADALTSLVDKSLVRVEPTAGGVRYSLNETTRQYAAERLARDPLLGESARLAHAHAFLQLAESAGPRLRGPDQSACLERLQAERANLRVALSFLSAIGAWAEAIRLAVALRTFWARTASYREGMEVLEVLLKDDHHGAPALLRASACATMGMLATQVNANETVEMFVTRGLLLVEEVGSDGDSVAARLLAARALSEWNQGRAETAASILDEAAPLAVRGGDEGVAFEVLNQRASVRRDLHDLDGARADAIAAADIAERIMDGHALARVLIGFGEVEAEAGDFESARKHWERGLETADPRANMTLQQMLAAMALMHSDVVEAALRSIDALRMRRDDSDSSAMHSLMHAALCVSANGDFRHSAELHGAADRFVSHGRDDYWDSWEADLRLKDLERVRRALGDEDFEAARDLELSAGEASRLAIDLLTGICDSGKEIR